MGRRQYTLSGFGGDAERFHVYKVQRGSADGVGQHKCESVEWADSSRFHTPPEIPSCPSVPPIPPSPPSPLPQVRYYAEGPGRSEGLSEGDVLLSNHPQLAGGSHLPDITAITPVFRWGSKHLHILGGEWQGHIC